MTNKTISIDVDGILADFYGDACKLYGKSKIKTKNFYIPWIGDVYEDIANNKNFWANMTPLIKPEELDFTFDHYITSLREERKGERKYWLENNGYPNKPLHLSSNKEIVCDFLNVDYHIDDKLETILKINEDCHTTTGILHLPDYLEYDNIPKGTIVTRSLKELNSKLKTLTK